MTMDRNELENEIKILKKELSLESMLLNNNIERLCKDEYVDKHSLIELMHEKVTIINYLSDAIRGKEYDLNNE